MDILELSERHDLLTFHHHTLLLYCSLCALGNARVSHALCSYLDQSQLLYAIQNPYLPGPLRTALYKLLIQVTKLFSVLPCFIITFVLTVNCSINNTLEMLYFSIDLVCPVFSVNPTNEVHNL